MKLSKFLRRRFCGINRYRLSVYQHPALCRTAESYSFDSEHVGPPLGGMHQAGKPVKDDPARAQSYVLVLLE